MPEKQEETHREVSKSSKMGITLDDWQTEIMNIEGNIALRSGRQVGKSTIISQKAAEYAIKNNKKTILIIASVERQASLLFEKTLGYLADNYKERISVGKNKPTKHIIRLKNGSTIYCLPTGISGYGIRGYTVDLLIADEAAFIPEEVWIAVTPMLAVTRGKIILLSTPFGKGGYFHSCFNDPNFKTFHISSEDCPRADKQFLQREKERMTNLQYAQEYLGEFVDELRQFFPTELIEKCMTIQREDSTFTMNDDNFLGVDVARMGGDETVLLAVHRRKKERIRMIDMEITEKTYLTETINRIKNMDKRYVFKRIYIDDGGMGVGVFDPLLVDKQTQRKVIAINNSSRSLDREEDGQKKRLMKEDLYNNLLRAMEQGYVELFKEPEIMLSLKSVQYEYDNGKLKIFGNYTHITEALVRAAWCLRDKHLNIFVEYF